MIEARPAPFATLRATVAARRAKPILLLPAPEAFEAPAAQAGDRFADLRFFATCYAAGLIFFLVMLS